MLDCDDRRDPPPAEGKTLDHCRFRTSYGGALFCRDTPYMEGFCRFHFRALQNGEINEHGVLNERLFDQDRRREINFHGIPASTAAYREDEERT